MKAITKLSQLDLSKRYSYADYITWQFKERVELIKGWILEMSPAPNLMHQTVSFRITTIFGNFFENQNCKAFAAPFDVRLTKKSKSNQKVFTVVQPDLCIICDEAKLETSGCIGSPDLIVEKVSPGNSKRDLKIKFDLYQENGVLEYWVIEPIEKYVQQFSLVKNKYQYVKSYFEEDVLESVVFKNLKIPVKNIFKK